MLSLIPFDNNEKRLFDMFGPADRHPVPRPNMFRCDIQDKGTSYAIEAELPGYTKSDIDVNVNGDILTISAKQTQDTEETDKKNTYIRRERRFGQMSRSFDVSDINTSDIKASYKNGILELNLPKIKETEPKELSIAIDE